MTHLAVPVSLEVVLSNWCPFAILKASATGTANSRNVPTSLAHVVAHMVAR